MTTFTVQYSDTGENDSWQDLADADEENIQVNNGWVHVNRIMFADHFS